MIGKLASISVQNITDCLATIAAPNEKPITNVSQLTPQGPVCNTASPVKNLQILRQMNKNARQMY